MYQVYIDFGDNEENCQILDSFAVSVAIAEIGVVTLQAAPPQDFLRPGAASNFEKCYGQFWRPRWTKCIPYVSQNDFNAEKMSHYFLTIRRDMSFGSTRRCFIVWRCYDEMQ